MKFSMLSKIRGGKECRCGREGGGKAPSMCIRLLITEPPIDPIRLPAGNLLNQLLGIGGLTEGQSYGNLNLGMPVSLP